MPQRGVLEIGNFRLGARADGALRDDNLQSARSLKNFDIIYSDGRLRVRKGYEKYNAVALAGAPTQLYHFRTMSDPDKSHVLCIADDNWYVAEATGAHTQLSTEDATAPRPVFEYGDRVFFGTDGSGTDIGFRWTDDTAIGAATSYRVGIVRPAGPPGVTLMTSEGHVPAVTLSPNVAAIAGGAGLRLNAITHIQLAGDYTPAADQTVRNIILHFMPLFTTQRGSIRVSIYTGLAEPTTLLSTDAISDWVEIVQFTTSVYTYYSFVFQDDITLTAGTRYWAVIESDENYKDNYNAANFYVAFTYSIAAPLGTSLVYNGAVWGNEPAGFKGIFLVGGLDPYHVYDYKTTYRNDLYVSESRATDKSDRISPTYTENRILVTTYLTGDAQVDSSVIYRRDIGTDHTLLDDEITTDFNYVDTLTPGNVYTDAVGVDFLGARLQTEDHYLFDEVEDEGEGVRTEPLQPNVATLWKDRIWFAEADANILYMSKVLAENGATGLIGDAIPDYFPLENRLEMPVPSGIIALRAISDDMLAVYFKDESIWVIWGANDPQNPPSDLRIDDKTPANGLIGTPALDRLEGRHIIMTRDGVYAFHSSGALQFLSETNQSVFDAIETANLEKTVVTVYGNEIWCLVDEDNDGALDTILILDMQRDVQTRQLFDRAWRTYDYGLNLNDVIVRKTGSTFKTLLAASADTSYIFELNTGTLDDGSPIVAEVETHDLRLPERVMLHQVQLVPGSYASAPPVYELTLTDHRGQAHFYELHPASSDDVRGHRVGCRLVSAPQARAQVTMRTVNEDELLGLAVHYAGRI